MNSQNVSFSRHRRRVNDPSLNVIQKELMSAKSIDDFFGKEGIFSRLFANTIKEMMEAELTSHLGYEKHAVLGRNTGNSRNGNYSRSLKTSVGETEVEIPHDRNGTFSPVLLKK